MSSASRRFALAGKETGKTINKGGFQFIRGVYTHEGAHDPTPELATYLERSYYAFPEGSQQHRDAQDRYEREQKSGKTEAAVVADHAAEEQPSEEIRVAVEALDHEDDAHWEENGRPKLEAVADFAGFEVNRPQVELAAPGYNRAAAKAASAI